jgi:hypothetical protein
LCHVNTFRRVTEMEQFRDSDEVPEVTQFHQ